MGDEEKLIHDICDRTKEMIKERQSQSKTKMKYYVLTDEYEPAIYEFDTEEDVIKFDDRCTHMEVTIYGIFKGERLEVQKTTKLVPRRFQ